MPALSRPPGGHALASSLARPPSARSAGAGTNAVGPDRRESAAEPEPTARALRRGRCSRRSSRWRRGSISDGLLEVPARAGGPARGTERELRRTDRRRPLARYPPAALAPGLEPSPKGVRVSQSVIDRTLESGKPLLASKQLGPSKSMSELGISAALGLPLVAQGSHGGSSMETGASGTNTCRMRSRWSGWRRSRFMPGPRSRTRSTISGSRAGRARLEQSQLALTRDRRDEPRRRTLLDHVDLCAERDFDALIHGPPGPARSWSRAGSTKNPRAAMAPFVARQLAPASPGAVRERNVPDHIRGAFTGANTSSSGASRRPTAARCSWTSWGELATDHQARLPACSMSARFRRSAGSRCRWMCRVIAATNRDLDQAVEDGACRSDLFNRLGIRFSTTPAC